MIKNKIIETLEQKTKHIGYCKQKQTFTKNNIITIYWEYEYRCTPIEKILKEIQHDLKLLYKDCKDTIVIWSLYDYRYPWMYRTKTLVKIMVIT